MHVQYAHALDECAMCCKILGPEGNFALLLFLFRTPRGFALAHMEHFSHDFEITLEPHNFATQGALVQSIEYVRVRRYFFATDKKQDLTAI